METKVEQKKTYVEQLRDIRDKMSLEIMDMNFEQLKEYLDKRNSLFPAEVWEQNPKAQQQP